MRGFLTGTQSGSCRPTLAALASYIRPDGPDLGADLPKTYQTSSFEWLASGERRWAHCGDDSPRGRPRVHEPLVDPA